MANLIKQLHSEGIELDYIKSGTSTCGIWNRKHGEAKGNIILIHGGSYSSTAVFHLPKNEKYSLIMRLHCEGYNVFAIDLSGYGVSKNIEESKYETYLSEVRSAIEHVKCDNPLPIHLVGWSFGSHLAASVAEGNTNISSVTIWGGFWGGGRHGVPDLIRSIPYPDFAERVNAIEHAGWDFNVKGSYDSNIKEKFVNWSVSVDPYSPTAHLKSVIKDAPLFCPSNIKVATLLVHGEYDRISNKDDMLACLDALSAENKTYIEIKGSGHNCHQGLQIDRFLSCLLVFFESIQNKVD
ncbi:alpha/beta hydrolase [Vibrio lentus]|uniref:alpha/beta hydrolase n=1 Tax=Vibrio lentus TaxID=136468 RepID=UPI000CAD7B5E|nr:alpha/beta hydrolase [Vibrio lentus]PMI80188.1 hypothetical protein BCU36_17075 [Vibrio lentus]